MNLYAQLANVKGDLKMTGDSDDAEIVRMIDDVSAGVDDYTGRHFYSQVETRYLPEDPARGGRELWLPWDLVSIATSKTDPDGDGVYETTVVENTDYRLYPRAGAPKYRLDIDPNSTVISSWPGTQWGVELVGIWGYSQEVELTGALVDDDPLAADAVTLNVDTGKGSSQGVGETLLLGDEQVYASGISTDALTLVRGINGTTAVAHAKTTPVYRRRYPRPVERAVAMQVIRFLRDHHTGLSGQAGSSEVGGFSFTTLYPAIRDQLAPYRFPGVSN